MSEAAGAVLLDGAADKCVICVEPLAFRLQLMQLRPCGCLVCPACCCDLVRRAGGGGTVQCCGQGVVEYIDKRLRGVRVGRGGRVETVGPHAMPRPAGAGSVGDTYLAKSPEEQEGSAVVSVLFRGANAEDAQRLACVLSTEGAGDADDEQTRTTLETIMRLMYVSVIKPDVAAKVSARRESAPLADNVTELLIEALEDTSLSAVLLRALTTGSALSPSGWRDTLTNGPNKEDDKKRVVGAYTALEIMRRCNDLAARRSTSLGHLVLSQLHAHGARGSLFKLFTALSVCGGKATLTRSLNGALTAGFDFKAQFPLWGLVMLIFDNVGFQEINKNAKFVQWVHMLWVVVSHKQLLDAGVYAKSRLRTAPDRITLGERHEDYQALSNRSAARMEDSIDLAAIFACYFNDDGREIDPSGETKMEQDGKCTLETTLSNFDGLTCVEPPDTAAATSSYEATAQMETEYGEGEREELEQNEAAMNATRNATMYDDLDGRGTTLVDIPIKHDLNNSSTVYAIMQYARRVVAGCIVKAEAAQKAGRRRQASQCKRRRKGGGDGGGGGSEDKECGEEGGGGGSAGSGESKAAIDLTLPEKAGDSRWWEEEESNAADAAGDGGGQGHKGSVAESSSSSATNDTGAHRDGSGETKDDEEDKSPGKGETKGGCASGARGKTRQRESSGGAGGQSQEGEAGSEEEGTQDDVDEDEWEEYECAHTAAVYTACDGAPSFVIQDHKNRNPGKHDCHTNINGPFHLLLKATNNRGILFGPTHLHFIHAVAGRDTLGRRMWVLEPSDPNQLLSELPEIVSAHYVAAAMAWKRQNLPAPLLDRDPTAQEVQTCMIERSREYPIVFVILLELRLSELILALSDAERNQGSDMGKSLYDKTRRLLQLYFAVGNNFKYCVLGSFEDFDWEKASPMEREIHMRYLWKRLTVNGKTIFTDRRVEWAVRDVRKYMARKWNPKTSEGRMRSICFNMPRLIAARETMFGAAGHGETETTRHEDGSMQVDDKTIHCSAIFYNVLKMLVGTRLWVNGSTIRVWDVKKAAPKMKAGRRSKAGKAGGTAGGTVGGTVGGTTGGKGGGGGSERRLRPGLTRSCQ
jgi:hypothetical protein